MEMSGSRTLAATQQQAWDALNDPEVLKQCIMGCDSIEQTGEGKYDIAMSVKIGPVSAKFKGKIEMQDVKAPTSYTLNFEGQGGAAGFGKGSSTVSLAPVENGTELTYTAKAQVGGKIAQVGQRLIDGVAKSMAEDFFKKFETVLAEKYPAASATAIDSGAAPTHSAGENPSNGIKIPLWAWIAGGLVLVFVLRKMF